MLLVDTKEKRIIQDVQLKLDIARSRPHSDWLREQVKNMFQSLLKLNKVITIFIFIQKLNHKTFCFVCLMLQIVSCTDFIEGELYVLINGLKICFCNLHILYFYTPSYIYQECLANSYLVF